MLVRALLSVFAVFAVLAGVAVAQTPNCPSTTDTILSCTEIDTTMNSGATLTISFTYDVQSHAICAISGGLIQGTGTQFAIIQGQNAPTGSMVRVNTVGGVIEATNVILSFAINGVTATLGSTSASALVTGFGAMATLTYSPFSISADPIRPSLTGTNLCQGDTFGDPHFSGFFGQQFCVFGHAGGILNIISDNNFQLNARLQTLEAGQAMTETQMKLVRMVDSSLPNTRWFDHAGTYMTELGLALLDGHRVYGQAGSYQTGWESLLIDDVEFAVGDKRVIGAGAEAVTVTRQDAHKVFVQTRFVSVYITNADNFFNVEHAKTEKAYRWGQRPFGGALGKTANPTWRPHRDGHDQEEIERDAAVESNNLFEISTLAK